MSKNKNKPPINISEIKSVVPEIVGKNTKVLRLSPLTPERDQKVYLCELEGKEKLVIKRATQDEWENQTIAYKLGIKTPKIVGSFFEMEREKDEKTEKMTVKGVYAQEYIEYERGKGDRTLENLMKEKDASCNICFTAAVKLLFDIHNQLSAFRNKKNNLPTFTEDVVKEQMKERINNRLLPVLEKYGDKVKKSMDINRWKKALNSFEIKKTSIFLGFEGNIPALVRWDYKPDNLLVRKESRGISVFSIDWGILAVGSVWFDLGFLLADLERNKRKKYLKEYLYLQKRNNPQWKEFSFKDVERRMTAAYVLIQLIHASSNAKHILDKKDTPYTHERLFDHLNKLVKEIS